MTVETELQEAIEAIQSANGLVREQEGKVARMKGAGLDTSRAESLLAAYRTAARYAAEHRDQLQALAQAKPEAKTGYTFCRLLWLPFQNFTKGARRYRALPHCP
jgi:hypothetical protein